MTPYSASQLTIVIPTKNRPDYIDRLLKYFSETQFRHQLIIGDSSEGRLLGETQEAVQRYAKRLQVEYQHHPVRSGTRHGIGGIACVARMLEGVGTPYALYMADDDFIVTSAIEKALRFLEAHPDYVAATGTAILVGLEINGADHRVLGTSDYLQRSVESEVGAERLMEHCRWHGATEFSVKRTDVLRDAFKAVMDLDLSNLFEEFFVNCVTVIRGKIKKLDTLYMVRRGHTQQTSSGNLTMFDWVVSPQFHVEYERFEKYLAKELSRMDALKTVEAAGIVKREFWHFLAFALNKTWQHRFGASRETDSLVQQAKFLARRYPAIRTQWTKLRSMVPDQKGRASLPALLRRNSPFYAEFTPIYKLIAEK